MIDCENPSYIFNRSINRISAYHPLKKLFQGRPMDWQVKKEELNEDNFKLYQYLDSVTGEVYDAFLEVPCCHCLLCQKKRQLSIQRRMMYEAQTCNGDIVAVTLTYSDEHLVKKLTKKAADDYISAVRKYMQRHKLHTRRFGWYYGSEHGKHRPHYHFIFFGLDRMTIDQLKDVFQGRWSNGIAWIDPLTYKGDEENSISVAASIRYTTKYCVKDAVGEDSDDVFQHWSRGLGSTFLKQQRNFIVNNPNAKNIKYYDYFEGKMKPVVIDKVFCYYVFDRFKYPKYLEGRKYLEKVGTEYAKDLISKRIEQGRIDPEYCPIIRRNKLYKQPIDHIYEIIAISNIEKYCEIQRLRNTFLSNNFTEIDSVTRKELRDLRLRQIESDLATRIDKEKI